MKIIRRITLGLSLIFSTLLITACGTIRESSESEKDILVNNVCSKLNDLIAKEVNTFKVSIITSDSDDTLTSSYEIVKSGSTYNILYSYELLTTFELVDGTYIIPSERITTHLGRIVVVDNTITYQDGDPLNVSLESITNIGLTFENEYFTDEVLDSNKFIANVGDITAFVGRVIETDNMQIEVSYTSLKITNLVMNYDDVNNRNVLISFLF